MAVGPDGESGPDGTTGPDIDRDMDIENDMESSSAALWISNISDELRKEDKSSESNQYDDRVFFAQKYRIY